MQSCDPEAMFTLCHLGLLPKSLNENRKKRRKEEMRKGSREGKRKGKG